ncbi:MAG: hypothetical protein O3C40_01870 [Planctomycetota bacterium]|nr:hypothetical protein [Planctomycetota bacterium]
MKLQYAFTTAAVVCFAFVGRLSAQDGETQQQLNRILIEARQDSFIPSRRPNAPNWTPLDFQGDGPSAASEFEIFNQRPRVPIDDPSVQLIRGSQVLEISNNALYRSGLFDAAVGASRELSGLAAAVQSAESRWNRLSFEQQKAAAAKNRILADAIGPEVLKAEQDVQFYAGKFAQSLQRIGLNGAQVAEVISNEGSTQPQHVLIRAVDSAPDNNYGYTTTRVLKNGQLGVTTVPSEYLLPTPVDANDVFFSTAIGNQRLQDGVIVKVTDEQKINPIARVNAMPRFGFFYDTGRQTGSGNFARNVSLLGNNDPAAGQTDFFQEGGSALTQFDLLFDTQILDVGGHTLQFFADTNNDRDVDKLGVEHLGFRAYNRNRGSAFEGWALAIGQAHSVFSQVALRPASIQTTSTLIGTSDRTNNNLPQLAVHIPIVNDVKWKIAVEDPYTGDLFNAPGSNLASSLTRWPTLATNVGWSNLERQHALQFGGILRNVGFQDAAGAEHFGTAWGLSATGKIGRESGGGLFFGVAGGDGVGDYIQGIEYSTVAGPSSLNTINGIGTYIGFQDVKRDGFGKTISEMNLAYGYSWMETPALLGPNVDQKFHQAWVNYLRFFSDYMAIGFEYQYGYRQAASGDQGENHRFLMLIALKTGPVKQSTTVAEDASRNSREFRVDGRAVSDVVYQDQFGGPAYAQQS